MLQLSQMQLRPIRTVWPGPPLADPSLSVARCRRREDHTQYCGGRMRVATVSALAALSLLGFVAHAAVAQPAAARLWPQPSSVSRQGQGVSMDPSTFTWSAVGAESGILTRAMARYKALTFPAHAMPGPDEDSLGRDAVGSACAGLAINVTGASTALGSGTDESYTLVVAAPTATLSAGSVYGALRGLETFSQLVTCAAGNAGARPHAGVPQVEPTGIRTAGTSASCASFSAPSVTVSDAPRFGFRGIMLDLARRFLPLSLLRAVVDAMSYDKMNVLHLHLTDDQSWCVTVIGIVFYAAAAGCAGASQVGCARCGSTDITPHTVTRANASLVSLLSVHRPLEVPAYPSLTSTGAFSPARVYSQADMQALVAYAQDRGVRVVPEVDSPGHSLSWVLGAPGTTINCSAVGATAAQGVVDPTVNATWAFVRGLYTALAATFTDEAVHVGGDEVDAACWAAVPRIVAWLKAQGMPADASTLQAFYEQKLVCVTRARWVAGCGRIATAHPLRPWGAVGRTDSLSLDCCLCAATQPPLLLRRAARRAARRRAWCAGRA